MKESNEASRSIQPQTASSLRDRISPLPPSPNPSTPLRQSPIPDPPLTFSTFNFSRLSSAPQPHETMAVPSLLGRMMGASDESPHQIEPPRTVSRQSGSETSISRSNQAGSGVLSLLQRFSGAASSPQAVTLDGQKPVSVVAKSKPPPLQDVVMRIVEEPNGLGQPEPQPQSQPLVMTTDAFLDSVMGPPPDSGSVSLSPPQALSPSSDPKAPHRTEIDLTPIEESTQATGSIPRSTTPVDALMEDVPSYTARPAALSPPRSIPPLFSANPFEGTPFALPKASPIMDDVYNEVQLAQQAWAQHADDLRLEKIATQQKGPAAVLPTSENVTAPRSEASKPLDINRFGPSQSSLVMGPKPTLLVQPTATPPASSANSNQAPVKLPVKDFRIDSPKLPPPSRPPRDSPSEIPGGIAQQVVAEMRGPATEIQHTTRPAAKNFDPRIRTAVAAAIANPSPASSPPLVTRSSTLSNQVPKPAPVPQKSNAPSRDPKFAITNTSAVGTAPHTSESSTGSANASTSNAKPGAAQVTAGVKRKAASPTRTSPPKSSSTAMPIDGAHRTAPRQAPQGSSDARMDQPPSTNPAQIGTKSQDENGELGARKRPRIEDQSKVAKDSDDPSQRAQEKPPGPHSRNPVFRPSSPPYSPTHPDTMARGSRTRDRYPSAPGVMLGQGAREQRPIRSRSPPGDRWADTDRRAQYARYAERADSDEGRYYRRRSRSPLSRFKDDPPYADRFQRRRSRSPSPGYSRRYDRLPRSRSPSPPPRLYSDHGRYQDKHDEPQRGSYHYDAPRSPPRRVSYRPPSHRPISLASPRDSASEFDPVARITETRRSGDYSTPDGPLRPSYTEASSYISTLHNSPRLSETVKFSHPASHQRHPSDERNSHQDSFAPSPRTVSGDIRSDSWSKYSSPRDEFRHDGSKHRPALSPDANQLTRPEFSPEHERQMSSMNTRGSPIRIARKDLPPKAGPISHPPSRPRDSSPTGFTLASRMEEPRSQVPLTLVSRITDSRRPTNHEEAHPKRPAPSLMARMN